MGQIQLITSCQFVKLELTFRLFCVIQRLHNFVAQEGKIIIEVTLPQS